jgi:chromate transporter
LGLTAFGGPAAHVALFRDEFVRRRGWLSEQGFMDLLGAANLLPGPTSTEVALGVGYGRAGWRGMLVSGGLFILPASLMVLALAIAYQRLGMLAEWRWVAYGIQPVVVVVVVRAIVGLAPAGLKEPVGWVIAGLAASLGYLGVHPLLVLAGAALAIVASRGLSGRMTGIAAGGWGVAGAGVAGAGAATALASVTLLSLFVTFVTIGTIAFGSGYLLLAFLRDAFVVPGLLSDRQLLDAVAVGQITPGPLFTSATFIGYLLLGVPGAVVATVGIFLPAFVFVGLSHRWLPRMRQSKRLAAALDGINAAALGLLAAVALELARAAIVDVGSLLIAGAAAALVWRDRVGITWLLAGGALAGVALHLARLVS